MPKRKPKKRRAPTRHDLPSNVTYLGLCAGNGARIIGDLIDAKEITHAVMAYRMDDGEIVYETLGDDERTFLVGMLARVMGHLDRT